MSGDEKTFGGEDPCAEICDQAEDAREIANDLQSVADTAQSLADSADSIADLLEEDCWNCRSP